MDYYLYIIMRYVILFRYACMEGKDTGQYKLSDIGKTRNNWVMIWVVLYSPIHGDSRCFSTINNALWNKITSIYSEKQYRSKY